MSSDFEIYNNIVAILFSFYVFLTFTEKKKYISNLTAGFALYLIALSMFVFREIIISGTSETLFLIFLKSSYFSAPFLIYNALSELANRKNKNAGLFLAVISIVWSIASGILRIPFDIQLIPLVCISASIYLYTAFILIGYKQIGISSRVLSVVILTALSVMFLYVPFLKTGDAFEFIDGALKSSILLVIALMVSLIMMYFQKVRAILVEQQQQIDYLVYHDEVTGLYNKTYFNEKSEIFHDPANYPISAITIDSAVLSIVNSKYGIFSNEQVLRDTARDFGKIKKENEVFYKLGSDEILIILLNTGYDEAKIRAMDYHRLVGHGTSDGSAGFLFGTGTIFDPISDPYRLVEEALSNLYINKLINNRKYVGNFLTYFSSKIHQQEGKSEERLQKVKKMAINLGYRLGLDENEMERLSRICDLYDIGKISIPFRILEKKDELSSQEWDIIRKYPDFSYDIVNTVYADKELAEAVRAVRERWDGRGYTKKLANEKIPRIARLLSIVESYDSMINSIFIEKKSISEAIEEIKKNKGTQFDPEMVDIFVEYIKEKCSPIP
jgi:GGDEF domain-containing protein